MAFLRLVIHGREVILIRVRRVVSYLYHNHFHPISLIVRSCHPWYPSFRYHLHLLEHFRINTLPNDPKEYFFLHTTTSHIMLPYLPSVQPLQLTPFCPSLVFTGSRRDSHHEHGSTKNPPSQSLLRTTSTEGPTTINHHSNPNHDNTIHHNHQDDRDRRTRSSLVSPEVSNTGVGETSPMGLPRSSSFHGHDSVKGKDY